MRSYNVKENHIDSAVREILWYRQTHTHRHTETDPVTFIKRIVDVFVLVLYEKDN